MLSPTSRVTDWRKRSWQLRQRQQDTILQHVCVYVCVYVDQLWQNMWKDEKRMTAIIPAHTAHWSPPNAIQSQSSCSAVAPLWMPDQDTHRILTSLILSEISDAISDLFSGWNIRTQLGRHIHFSYVFFSELKKKKLIQLRFHSVVFRQSIQSCLHLELLKKCYKCNEQNMNKINNWVTHILCLTITMLAKGGV